MKYSTLLVAAVVLVSCTTSKMETPSDQTAFTNFTLIDGTGSQPVADAVLIIKGDEIINVGPKASTEIPDNTKIIDLQGKYIMPGIINTHGHVGDVKGIEGGHYSLSNVIDNLEIYARYGITTVVSLGGDQKIVENLRDVNDSSTTGRSRLYIAGAVITGKTPAEAMAVVDSNKVMGVDWMKIRVDDNLGTAPKMTEDVYKAVIDRSHELGYKIATHMYYLDDAKKLLAAGSDFMAHSVRDLPVDEEFINLLKQRKVCYCPTLTRELSTFVYGTTPAFFSDPFFQKEYDSVTIKPLKDPARQAGIRDNKSAQTYRQQLPVALGNLRTLSNEGVTIAFGTDSGVPTRFLGYFEHMELVMMGATGMSYQKIIRSATKDAAECMGLKRLGWLTPGYKADFLVLTMNPYDDIKFTRKIESVWIGGEEIKR
jgi:imidazolonepropionase-like amidohydrolase